MLFRKPNRRRKMNKKASGVSAVESVEDRLLLSAGSLLMPGAPPEARIAPQPDAGLNEDNNSEEPGRERRRHHDHRGPNRGADRVRRDEAPENNNGSGVGTVEEDSESVDENVDATETEDNSTLETGDTDTQHSTDDAVDEAAVEPEAVTVTETEMIMTSVDATDVDNVDAEDSIAAESDVVLQWNNLFGDLLIADNINQNPGYASRSMAMLNVAIYDAVSIAAGNPDSTFYDYDSDILNTSGSISADVVASQAAHTVLSSLYPNQQAMIDAFLDSVIAENPDADASIALGTAIGNSIVATRADDGWDATDVYVGTDAVGSFQVDPLNPDVPVWGPVWGELETFAISATEAFAPHTTPPLSSEDYAASYNEVLELGSVDSTERTAGQTEAGLFWAYDREGLGTPLSLYNDVLIQIASQEGNSLEENAALFAQASVAMADAAIVAWDTKFSEEFWRPITAIHAGDDDGNPLTEGDTEWTALGAPAGNGDIVGFTPQFPTYISGHATFGGALFGTLQDFYGTDDISFELTSTELEILLADPDLQAAYGLDLDDATRSFDSFSEAMAENGRSRVYLGIHFDFDDLVGQEVGQAVAAAVAAEFDALGVASPALPTTDASEFASIDGTGNNIDNPELGSTNTQLLRLADADYGDGVSSPAGEDRPSAREVSNVIAAAESSETNDRYLTDIFWVWGQFIDHDIDLTGTALNEEGAPEQSVPIEVPAGDVFFDPTATGEAIIDFSRSVYVEGDDGVREQVNQITAFIDGSVIYGSDAERTAELRTFEGGLLKTSEGDLLQYNEAGLDNAGGPFDSLFLAGDIRANENVALTAMQTIWVREHNRIATELAAENPDLTDEELYQQARQIVGGELQAITFNEFLPALFGTDAISDYAGYDSTVDPSIANEFSTAAYRFGHTLLSSELLRLDENGDVADEGNLALLNAFFNPGELEENDIDSLLRGATVNVAQELDNEVVDDIRNFLFGAPGSGGFDLASLNIQRGRDHGLADYNSTRVALGLDAVQSFSDISSDPEVAAKLEELYGTVDNIDLWVGGLAEDHLPGSSMGQTFSTIIIDQFERLRDGDRFWYENVFSGDDLAEIQNTTLADVIERNTNITGLQDTVFFAPTVARVDLAEIGSDDVTLHAVDGNLEVVDNRSQTVVNSQSLADMERIMVVGLNGQADRIVVEGLTAADLPGGISIESGDDAGDTLVVGGTASTDHIAISSGLIDVNGMAMEMTGAWRVVVVATDGVGNVHVADDVNFRVDIVDGTLDDHDGHSREDHPRDDRRNREIAKREKFGRAVHVPSARERRGSAMPPETPKRTAQRTQRRSEPTVAAEENPDRTMNALDRFFAAGDLDDLSGNAEQRRR